MTTAPGTTESSGAQQAINALRRLREAEVRSMNIHRSTIQSLEEDLMEGGWTAVRKERTESRLANAKSRLSDEHENVAALDIAIAALEVPTS